MMINSMLSEADQMSRPAGDDQVVFAEGEGAIARYEKKAVWDAGSLFGNSE